MTYLQAREKALSIIEDLKIAQKSDDAWIFFQKKKNYDGNIVIKFNGEIMSFSEYVIKKKKKTKIYNIDFNTGEKS